MFTRSFLSPVAPQRGTSRFVTADWIPAPARSLPSASLSESDKPFPPAARGVRLHPFVLFTVERKHPHAPRPATRPKGSKPTAHRGSSFRH